MRTLHITALSILLALGLAAGAARTACAQDSIRTTPQPLEVVLTRIVAAAQVRDSLSRLADKATGEQSSILEEQVWQAQLVVQEGISEAVRELETMKTEGKDLFAARAVLQGAATANWPRYRRQLERRERLTLEILSRREGATAQQRLEIESEFAASSERVARMYRDLVDAILPAEHAGLDVAAQRAFVSEKVSRASEQTRIRLVVLGRAQALAAARLQRKPDDVEAQLDLEAASAAFNQTAQNLETEISLLKQLGKDVTDLRVALIVARGTLTSAIFEPGVIQGLFAYARLQVMEMLAARGPHWLFEGLMVVLILGGFWLLGRLTRYLVGRAVATSGMSQLMKDTVVGWSGRLVFFIGLVAVLRQFGVQLGPMLAGLGIAGFVLGFALQDTLSNFAAGGMILAYHPYDVGDAVEAGGAMGIVKHMSLVSTTILTDDNQTLIVPNKKMWGDVIRNKTSQSDRRVDLVFATGYGNDIAVVERLLQEIASADPRVLKVPAPVIKLDQLAESSIKFVVRVWTRQENYWNVYWDITRAVKLRFDQEGIKFPQHELNVNMLGARTDGPGQANPPVETP